ncbi:MAG: hypothetical protein ACFFD4_08555 [Candidatus Odinarchaeota archaeon]
MSPREFPKEIVLITFVALILSAFAINLLNSAMKDTDFFLFMISLLFAVFLIIWVLKVIISGDGERYSKAVNSSKKLRRYSSTKRGYREARRIGYSDVRTISLADNMELVPDDEKPIHGKPEDTCRFCGDLLPVDALDCPACNNRRSTCPVCKRNIDVNFEIAVCPMCRNEFHLAHLREAVKVTGKCPVCRSKIRRYEILVRKSQKSAYDKAK